MSAGRSAQRRSRQLRLRLLLFAVLSGTVSACAVLWYVPQVPAAGGAAAGLLVGGVSLLPGRRAAGAWQRGAEGEELTARVLDRLPRRWVTLHDRAVRGTRANIDHLLVGPGGVVVVDTKHYRGRVLVRRGWVRRQWTFEVGGTDRSGDIDKVYWQCSVVEEALADGGWDLEVAGMLCMHDVELARRARIAGVEIATGQTLRRRVLRRRRQLSSAQVTEVAALLEGAFPAA